MSTYYYFGKKKYWADDAISAAIKMQKSGKDKAIEVLKKMGNEDTDDLQLFILCRMLFKASSGLNFRAPLIGISVCICNTDPADWPLAPIAIENGIPFLICRDYSVKGKKERSSDYLDYCLGNCIWNNYSYQVPVLDEKLKALEKIKSSVKLKGGLSENEKAWILSQIV